jgi:hypothetical protein
VNDTKPDAVEAARETLSKLAADLRQPPFISRRDADAIDTVLAALATAQADNRNYDEALGEWIDRAKNAEAALATAHRERDEARRKSEIDEAQCDEMTRQAGEMAAALAQREEDVTRLREWADAKIERMLARADEIAVVIAKTLHEVLDRLTRHQPSGAKEGA